MIIRQNPCGGLVNPLVSMNEGIIAEFPHIFNEVENKDDGYYYFLLNNFVSEKEWNSKYKSKFIDVWKYTIKELRDYKDKNDLSDEALELPDESEFSGIINHMNKFRGGPNDRSSGGMTKSLWTYSLNLNKIPFLKRKKISEEIAKIIIIPWDYNCYNKESKMHFKFIQGILVTDFIYFDDTIPKRIKDSIKESTSVDFTKYFSFQDEDELSPGMFDSEEVLYRDPVYNKAITEYFDIRDKRTRKILLSMNEAGQNSVLMSLTSKLYDKIVAKCDDIDYGEIPATKGDITKLSKYNDMKETISIMHDLLKEYKQDTGPVDELSVALSNVEARRDLFERAYRYNSELPIAMYCNITLGIITGISYMIATCIEFIKDPGAENFRVALDKVAYAKTKDHMIYNTLKSFNKTCANKEFDKAMEAVLKASTKNFGGGVAAGGLTLTVIGIIILLIPVLRELIFMFYYMRMKISDFFDIQADLLQANAYSIESNSTLDKDKQKEVMAKQLKYVERFRKVSNAFAIDVKKAEVSADKEKKSDDETKMLIDDIDGIDTGSNGSALF